MLGTVTWQNEDRCVVGGKVFQTLPLAFEIGRWPASLMEGADFFLFKERTLVERYVELAEKLRPQRIFELGIYAGGSTAFLFELAHPRVLVAIDHKPPNGPALRNYIASEDLDEVIRIHDDVDQADRGRLAAIAAEAFGDEPLDLVIDDCSHLYEPTRASFNELFPRLRPGGVYVIEDWPWAHPPLEAEDPERVLYPGQVPLTRLLFEVMLAIPSVPGLIADVTVFPRSLRVTRGDAKVEPERFEIAACSNQKGRRLLAADG